MKDFISFIITAALVVGVIWLMTIIVPIIFAFIVATFIGLFKFAIIVIVFLLVIGFISMIVSLFKSEK